MSFTPGVPLALARRQWEREYLNAALDYHHGNESRVARELGIERSSCHRKLQHLGLRFERTLVSA